MVHLLEGVHTVNPVSTILGEVQLKEEFDEPGRLPSELHFA
jgi:hypothetical protein